MLYLICLSRIQLILYEEGGRKPKHLVKLGGKNQPRNLEKLYNATEALVKASEGVMASECSSVCSIKYFHVFRNGCSCYVRLFQGWELPVPA